jgi:hypothetical protein
MGSVRWVICAVLVAMTPVAAQARWSHRHGGWGRFGHHRSSGVWPRERDAAIPRTPCVDLAPRDDRGRLRRCAAVRAAFQRAHPCPSTGQPTGPCPGYVVDHIVPLKRGGADDPSNMQWQTVAEANAKDRVE